MYHVSGCSTGVWVIFAAKRVHTLLLQLFAVSEAKHQMDNINAHKSLEVQGQCLCVPCPHKGIALLQYHQILDDLVFS